MGSWWLWSNNNKGDDAPEGGHFRHQGEHASYGIFVEDSETEPAITTDPTIIIIDLSVYDPPRAVAMCYVVVTAVGFLWWYVYCAAAIWCLADEANDRTFRGIHLEPWMVRSMAVFVLGSQLSCLGIVYRNAYARTLRSVQFWNIVTDLVCTPADGVVVFLDPCDNPVLTVLGFAWATTVFGTMMVHLLREAAAREDLLEESVRRRQQQQQQQVEKIIPDEKQEFDENHKNKLAGKIPSTTNSATKLNQKYNGSSSVTSIASSTTFSKTGGGHSVGSHHSHHSHHHHPHQDLWTTLSNYRPPRDFGSIYMALCLSKAFVSFIVVLNALIEFFLTTAHNDPEMETETADTAGSSKEVNGWLLASLLSVLMHTVLEVVLRTIFPGLDIHGHPSVLVLHMILFLVHMLAASILNEESFFEDTSVGANLVNTWLFASGTVGFLRSAEALLEHVDLDAWLGLQQLSTTTSILAAAESSEEGD